jgi:hypothetical protein
MDTSVQLSRQTEETYWGLVRSKPLAGVRSFCEIVINYFLDMISKVDKLLRKPIQGSWMKQNFVIVIPYKIHS